MALEEKKTFKFSSKKLAALTLLLTVPVMMTGCNQISSNNECDPDYDDCDYDGTRGVYVYSSKSKKYKPSSGVKSGSSKSYSGFGSGGKSSSGG